MRGSLTAYKPFHVKTLVRYSRGRQDETIVRPVRFAYTVNGKTRLILEWDRQSEWLPLPAQNWVHADDGCRLGAFIPFNNGQMEDAVSQDWLFAQEAPNIEAACLYLNSLLTKNVGEG